MGMYLQKQFLAYCVGYCFPIYSFEITVYIRKEKREKTEHEQKNRKVPNMTPHNIPPLPLDFPQKLGIAKRQQSATTTDMTAQKNQLSFRARVEQYSARHIAAAVGCSLPTAYDWRSGRRAPPPWLQDQILNELASYHPQIRHHEKSA